MWSGSQLAETVNQVCQWQTDYEKGEKMEVLKMRTVIKPFKMKKLNKRLTLLLKQSLDNAPVAPLEQLRQEAAEFEKMMLKRRNSIG